MVSMPVRHDQERQFRPAILRHLSHGFLDAMGVPMMNSAIDKDVLGTVGSWHAHKKEIAEANPEHANS